MVTPFAQPAGMMTPHVRPVLVWCVAIPLAAELMDHHGVSSDTPCAEELEPTSRRDALMAFHHVPPACQIILPAGRDDLRLWRVCRRLSEEELSHGISTSVGIGRRERRVP